MHGGAWWCTGVLPTHYSAALQGVVLYNSTSTTARLLPTAWFLLLVVPGGGGGRSPLPRGGSWRAAAARWWCGVARALAAGRAAGWLRRAEDA